MITRVGLAQRLPRRNFGAWSVVERIQDIAVVDDRRALQRREHRTRLTLVVHIDVPRGRGSARLDLDSFDASPDDVIDQAASLARAAIGPAWFSAPPAAPAKVAISDDSLFQRELDAAARNTLAALRRPPGVTLSARLSILRETVTVTASSGFQLTWPATSLRADLSVSSASSHLAIVRTARRADDLELDLAIADAATDLALLASASPPAPGPVALWLRPDALLPDDDLGLWAVLAQQADPATLRHSLSRFRPGSELAAGAAQLAEPLSVVSDGALDHAIRSSPLSDDAVAVRRFPLVDRGMAIGVGLSSRDAALANTDPNGGVRNLVVSPGTWPAAPSPTVRTLEVRRLHALTLSPTGDATLDIALALDHAPDRAPRPVTTGTIHLDALASLALARRSPQLLRRGAYLGPASILIEEALLLA